MPYALALPLPVSSAHSVTLDSNIRPIMICYFIQHSWQLSETDQYSQTFAVCDWPQLHPNRHVMGKPVEVWCNDLFEPGTLNCFVPVQHIKSRVIIAVDNLCNENVLVVIPIL